VEQMVKLTLSEIAVLGPLWGGAGRRHQTVALGCLPRSPPRPRTIGPSCKDFQRFRFPNFPLYPFSPCRLFSRLF
jgi:hypothetical protein